MTSAPPPDLDRIRFVTRSYLNLQGLRSQVPVGAQWISFAIGGWLGVSLCLLACVWMLAGAPTYYRWRFGEVEQSARTRMPDAMGWARIAALAALTGILCYALPYQLAGPEAQADPGFLGPLRWLAFGASVLVGFWACGGCAREQRYYPVLAALLLATLLWLALARPAYPTAAEAQALGGAAFVLGGLLDHRLLVRSLPRAAEEEATAADTATDTEETR
jgi:hypothetical protein